MNRRLFSRLLATLCCVATLFSLASPVLAERADTIRMLPRNTYVYVSIADARQLADKFTQTGLGQMLQDDGLQPLLQQLFDELENIASPVTDEIGLTLTDLMMIPQGEITVAVLEQGEGLDPAFVMFADVHEQMLAVQQMLDRADEEFSREDRTREVEEYDGVEIISYDMPGDGDFVYFEKDGTLVISSSLLAAREFLATWDSGRSDGFHTNRAFATIVDRSRGPRSESPQVTWFVDPIALIKRGNDNFIVNNIMDGIGLNGLKCVGGSLLFATQDYDSISHFHLIMDHPRPGVLNVLAFEPGDATPDEWVPRDVGTFMAANFNVEDAFNTAADLVNRYQGEGFLQDQAQNAFRQLNLDFENDILPAIDNRFTYCTWIQKPVTISSQGQLVGIKLKDGAAFQKTFDEIVTQIKKNTNLEETPYAGKTYYAMKFGFQDQQEDQENPFGAEPPSPCFMLLNDYILFSDRVPALEEAIKASRGDVENLAADPDYQLVLETARRESGGEPALVGFSRPEVGLGFLYNLATGESSRDDLRNLAEDNEDLAGFSKALDDNPVPPFEDLQKYLAPTGGIMTSDETGLHYMSLGLKAKALEEESSSTGGR